ncbi:hypothetical protein F4859DRAFT_239068 [Xylaria cf. heliscus]|nr:hypothetical protein F4859DRAFT_239068 [Xylaria cf. heliscus]
MSDISADADFEFPFEVRSAGDSGLGCFATRDIKPGEIVLVDSTTILIEAGDVDNVCEQIAQRYDDLEEQDKAEWRSLTSHTGTSRLDQYRRSFRRRRPDGTPLFRRGAEFYAMLHVQFDCNAFAIGDTKKGGLFLSASRFNHSCDPNVVYESETVVGRWVGRANRNIAQGEQLFISYLAHHAPLADRQAKARAWDFSCGCDKCLERNDIYTAFLEDARDVANDAGMEWARTLAPHNNNIQHMEERLVRRVDLLKQANQQNAANQEEDKCFQKELIFALWDLAWFHEHYYITSRQNGDKQNFVSHLEEAIDNGKQAAALAKRIWPWTHQIVILLRKDIRRWQATWNNRDNPPMGMAG